MAVTAYRLNYTCTIKLHNRDTCMSSIYSKCFIKSICVVCCLCRCSQLFSIFLSLSCFVLVSTSGFTIQRLHFSAIHLQEIKCISIACEAVLKLNTPDYKPQPTETHLVRKPHLDKVCHHSNQLIDKTKKTSFLNKWNIKSCSTQYSLTVKRRYLTVYIHQIQETSAVRTTSGSNNIISQKLLPCFPHTTTLL